MQHLNIKKVLRVSTREHWTQLGYWIFVTLVATAVPIGLSLLLFKVVSVERSFWTHVVRGDVALVSVSLLVPSLVMLYKEKVIPIPERPILGFAGILMLVFSAVLFAFATYVTEAPTDGVVLNRPFVITVSIILYAISVFVIATIQLLDIIASDPRLARAFEQSRQKLEREFDALGENNDA